MFLSGHIAFLTYFIVLLCPTITTHAGYPYAIPMIPHFQTLSGEKSVRLHFIK